MSDFALFLFSVDPVVIEVAVAAGIRGVVVDWEHRDKARRQAGYDTEINRYGVAELQRVRHVTDATVLCRINNTPDRIAVEVESSIECGADEILVPMVRTVQEVERLLDRVRGRCGVGILIETPEAVVERAELGRLPLTRVYVGLNDLAIGFGHRQLFRPVRDGTLDAIRRDITVPFGWGGLTRPNRGQPVPCHLLIAEMARLRCGFSFLRRSFHADVEHGDLERAVRDIREGLRLAFVRDAARVERDRLELRAVLTNLDPGAAYESTA